MAPRRQRAKVGLTRMDAALDAMQPMGFSSGVVRKCVRKLLKVYGNEGWVFIEEASYKLLVDMILEEAEVPQPICASEHLMLEDASHENHVGPEPMHQLCDKEVMHQEQVQTLDICPAEAYGDGINMREEVNQGQESVVDINAGKQIRQEQHLDVKLSPVPLQVTEKLCLPPPRTIPNHLDTIPRTQRRRPCYGWISDNEDGDEDYDFIELAPTKEF